RVHRSPPRTARAHRGLRLDLLPSRSRAAVAHAEPLGELRAASRSRAAAPRGRPCGLGGVERLLIGPPPPSTRQGSVGPRRFAARCRAFRGSSARKAASCRVLRGASAFLAASCRVDRGSSALHGGNCRQSGRINRSLGDNLPPLVALLPRSAALMAAKGADD